MSTNDYNDYGHLKKREQYTVNVFLFDNDSFGKLVNYPAFLH